MIETSLISRAPDLLATELDGELVLMSIEKGNYYGVATTARSIWACLEQAKTLEALLDQLAGQYECPAGQMRADVLEFLEQLQREGLIVVA